VVGPENGKALSKFLDEFENIDRELQDLKNGGWFTNKFARYVRRRLQNRNVDMYSAADPTPTLPTERPFLNSPEACAWRL
jgi:hypothetical protein